MPVWHNYLNFNRFTLRAEKTLPLGPLRWVRVGRGGSNSSSGGGGGGSDGGSSGSNNLVGACTRLAKPPPIPGPPPPLQAVGARQGRHDLRGPAPLRGLPNRRHQLCARLRRRCADGGAGGAASGCSGLWVAPPAYCLTPPHSSTCEHHPRPPPPPPLPTPTQQAAWAPGATTWRAAPSCGCPCSPRWRRRCLGTGAATWTAGPASLETLRGRAASQVGCAGGVGWGGVGEKAEREGEEGEEGEEAS